MDRHIILGVHITDRLEHAPTVQKVLTEFGHHIKTRLGLHEVGPDPDCPPVNGLLLLELTGEESHCFELEARLKAISGIEVQRMVFDHPEVPATTF